MENVVEQLEALRRRRTEEAQRRYSEIILRYDAPQPGDAESMDCLLKTLSLDIRHLQADVRVIAQYRCYSKHEPGVHGGKQDADCIRRQNRHLFIAMQ